MKPSAALAMAIVLASVTGAPLTSAFEREHHFGGGVGVSLLSVDQKPTTDVGLGGFLHYAYGLTDQFNFVAEGSSSIVALEEKVADARTPRNRPLVVGTAGAGVTYAIDVTQFVPYIGLLADGYVFAKGTVPRPALAIGLQAAAGLDYRFARHFSAGVAFRQNVILSKMGDYPSFTNVFLRAEYSWGR